MDVRHQLASTGSHFTGFPARLIGTYEFQKWINGRDQFSPKELQRLTGSIQCNPLLRVIFELRFGGLFFLVCIRY